MPEDLTNKKDRLAKIQVAKARIEVRKQARYLDKGIEDKKHISFADLDDNILGKYGHVECAYSAQISVDTDKQIIVEQHVSRLANDYSEVVEALDKLVCMMT